MDLHVHEEGLGRGVGRVLIGFISLRIKTAVGLLWRRWWTLGFHSIRRISLLQDDRLCSLKGLSSVEVVCTEHIFSRVQLKCYGTRWRREGKLRGNWRMEWEASTLHTTSEHGVSSITTADVHTSAASSRLNWSPRRFKWTRPFRRKTKSGFCVCAITFQTQSSIKVKLHSNVLLNVSMSSHFLSSWFRAS